MKMSRGMGAISPAKMDALKGVKPVKPLGMKGVKPMAKGGVTKTRKDGDKFTEYAEGGNVGLYANINAKRKRGAKMRKPGDPGAPTAEAFKQSAKTARK